MHSAVVKLGGSLANAGTLGGWLNAGMLYWTLAKQGHFIADKRLKRSLPRIILATLIMSIVLWFVAGALGSRFEPPTRVLFGSARAAAAGSFW